MTQIDSWAEDFNLDREAPQAQLIPEIFHVLLSAIRPTDPQDTLNNIILL